MCSWKGNERSLISKQVYKNRKIRRDGKGAVELVTSQIVKQEIPDGVFHLSILEVFQNFLIILDDSDPLSSPVIPDQQA